MHPPPAFPGLRFSKQVSFRLVCIIGELINLRNVIIINFVFILILIHALWTLGNRVVGHLHGNQPLMHTCISAHEIVGDRNKINDYYIPEVNYFFENHAFGECQLPCLYLFLMAWADLPYTMYAEQHWALPVWELNCYILKWIWSSTQDPCMTVQCQIIWYFRYQWNFNHNYVIFRDNFFTKKYSRACAYM